MPMCRTSFLFVLVFAAGCSDDAPVTAAAATSGGVEPTSEVTFWEDVAPIVYENCTGCHVDGGIAPFEFISYEQVRNASHVIRSQIETRTMPPWGADNSGDCNTYIDARWLSDTDIATIGQWIDEGFAEGDPAAAPSLPSVSAGLVEPTTVLDAGVDYLPNEELSDDYRCFIVDPGFSDDMFITAYEVQPGDEQTVHHVILFSLDSEDAEDQAVALDAAETGPGYTCFGGSGTSNSTFVGGWAPGTVVTTYPDGTGIPMKAGRKAVMQVHYNTVGGVKPDRTTIALQAADDVAYPAQITQIAASDLLLPPGEKLVEASSTMTNPAPVPVRIHGVFPHMHQLGRTLRVELERDGGDVCLVDVPAWDFNWQQLYLYEDAVIAQPGDKVTITCGYDTVGMTETVTWGEGTQDEMCLNFFYVSQ